MHMFSTQTYKSVELERNGERAESLIWTVFFLFSLSHFEFVAIANKSSIIIYYLFFPFYRCGLRMCVYVMLFFCCCRSMPILYWSDFIGILLLGCQANTLIENKCIYSNISFFFSFWWQPICTFIVIFPIIIFFSSLSTSCFWCRLVFYRKARCSSSRVCHSKRIMCVKVSKWLHKIHICSIHTHTHTFCTMIKCIERCCFCVFSPSGEMEAHERTHFDRRMYAMNQEMPLFVAFCLFSL